MPRYGKLVNGELVTSETMLQGYKVIEYAKIPTDFDQTTHYISQSEPIDEGERIFVGIEVNELEIKDDDFEENIL